MKISKNITRKALKRGEISSYFESMKNIAKYKATTSKLTIINYKVKYFLNLSYLHPNIKDTKVKKTQVNIAYPNSKILHTRTTYSISK